MTSDSTRAYGGRPRKPAPLCHWLAGLGLAGALALTACDRAGPAVPVNGPLDKADATAATHVPAVVVFPKELHADDPEVNAFVTRALSVATGQDYEEFRLLWSAADEPLAKDQFERGWRSVRKIEIDVFQKMRAPERREIFYGMHASAALDPSKIPPDQDPRRDIVLIIRRENGQWRLAHAPDRVQDVVRRLRDDASAFGPVGPTHAAPPPP